MLRLDCQSTVGRRELTLFANGTVRLRDGLRGEEAVMRLMELGPEEYAALVRRIEEEDLGESEHRFETVGGAWVERCELDLELPGSSALEHFEFSHYDPLSLTLQRVVAVALELTEKVLERPPEGSEQIPAGYDPKIGDRLQRSDGVVFEIAAFTADGLGVELQGIEQPLTLYIPKGELARLFVALVPRDQRR